MASAVSSLGLEKPAPCRRQLGMELLGRITAFALDGCLIQLGRLLASTKSAIVAV